MNNKQRVEFEELVKQAKQQLGQISFDRYGDGHFAGQYKNGMIEFAWKIYLAKYKIG